MRLQKVVDALCIEMMKAVRVQVVSLRRLSHPAIIKLREVIREREELFFVFEFMVGGPIYQLLVN